jgi:hypothetical protein
MTKVDIFEVEAVDLARLHFDILNWSFTGKLGIGFIENLYRTILSHKDIFFGVALYDRNNRLVGFSIATIDYHKAREIISPLYKKLLFRVFINALTNFSFFLIMLESKFVIPPIYKKYGIYAEWLVFITDTKDKAIYLPASIALCRYMIREFKKRNILKVIGQFYSNQDKLIGFYQMIGGRIVNKLLVNQLIVYDIDKSKFS